MVFEHIRLGDQYYVLASALALRQPQMLLNHADSFAIFDQATAVWSVYQHQKASCVE